VEPEDIVILLRSPGTAAGYFQRALEERGIRCTTGAGDDLLKTEEICTLRSFLQAVESGKKDEAMGYFSSKIAEVVDYEELEGYLKDLKEYYCFAEDEGKGIRRVSVAKKNHKDEEIFSFRMVAEPDSFGKWKIFSIEREGKE
jgi:hypothetical protein